MFDCIIVGGGASGLFAASLLNEKRILIIEKNDRVGKKLAITALGQCNITSNMSMSKFKDKYNNYNFIKYALESFSNNSLIKYLNSRGIKTKSIDKKVFPSSLNANEIIDNLKQGLNINLNEKVISLEKNEDFIIRTNKNVYKAKTVIIATGGISYPVTGSTGDSELILKSLDIDHIPFSFALCPIYINKNKHKKLMGTSFNVTIEHYRKKKISKYEGDILITHFGYSGPVIINNSRYFKAGDEIYINFLKKTKDEFEKEIFEEINNNSKRLIKNTLYNYTTKKLVDLIVKDLKLENKRLAELKKTERLNIIDLLINYKVEIDKVGDKNSSMISKGGISRKEINRRNFESKKYNGLYFVGECVDIDGETGGYNLQYAFSSSFLAVNDILNKY